jgi:heme A synthase
MDTFFGIPAHPLFVHIPAVLIPLAAVGVVIMLVRPTWWERYKWATLAVAGAGMIGAILAAGSGEGLEEGVERSADRSQLRTHVAAGETARTVSIVFFIILFAAVVVVPWWMKRRNAATGAPKWLRPVVAIALVAGAGSASWTVFNAGHSGAKSVWGDVKAGEGRGGDRGEKGGEGDND